MQVGLGGWGGRGGRGGFQKFGWLVWKANDPLLKENKKKVTFAFWFIVASLFALLWIQILLASLACNFYLQFLLANFTCKFYLQILLANLLANFRFSRFWKKIQKFWKYLIFWNFMIFFFFSFFSFFRKFKPRKFLRLVFVKLRFTCFDRLDSKCLDHIFKFAKFAPK